MRDRRAPKGVRRAMTAPGAMRPGRGAGGARDPLQGAARGRETVINDDVQGASFSPTTSSTISSCCVPTAPDLYFRGRRRRSRHGRHPHHPRRRPPDQCRPAAQIYDALGWRVPVFAHIPLIHGPDGAKLSKRHGALGVDAYRAMGYLPAALRTILSASAGRMATTRSSRPRRWSRWFDSPKRHRPVRRPLRFRQAGEPTTATTSGPPTMPRCSRPCDSLPQLPRRETAALNDAERLAPAPGALPALKARANTLIELLDMAAFIFAERPLRPRRQGRRGASVPRPAPRSGRPRPGASPAEPEWAARGAGGSGCAPSPRRPGSSSARSPSRCAPR